MTSEREIHDVLLSIEITLEEILMELKRANATERTGAVSSVEIKALANGTLQPVIKAYTGSEPPVDEALESYGRTIREGNARAMAQWSDTLASVRDSAA